MRVAPIVALLLFVPAAAAEFGPYDDEGWPIGADGTMRPDPANQVLGTTLYPYYPILTAEVERLAADHPDLVRLTSAGQSTLGLELWLLEIANFAEADDAAIADREVVWLDGGTHSNEYSGVYFALAWAQFLLDEYETNETAKWIVDNRHTWIMPMINPDGSNAFGRLNANLVNINRNYPVIWDGEGNDAFMNNRGPEPASEIETQIVIEQWNLTQPDYMASIHCCGNLWLYPYGEEGVDPPAGDYEMLERICDEAFPGVRDDCGPIWSTIYPASGSSVDTAYEFTGAVSFGYEMSGRGAAGIWGLPLTVENVREQEHESWAGMTHAFLNVHKYGAHAVMAAYDDGGDLVLTISNDGWMAMNASTLAVGGHVIEVPALAIGETTQVRVADAAGADAALTYQKRVMAGPEGIAHPTDLAPLGLDEANDTPLPFIVGLVAIAFALARRRLA